MGMVFPFERPRTTGQNALALDFIHQNLEFSSLKSQNCALSYLWNLLNYKSFPDSARPFKLSYSHAERKHYIQQIMYMGTTMLCSWKVVKIVLQHPAIHRTFIQISFIKTFKEVSIVSLYFLDSKWSSPKGIKFSMFSLIFSS